MRLLGRAARLGPWLVLSLPAGLASHSLFGCWLLCQSVRSLDAWKPGSPAAFPLTNPVSHLLPVGAPVVPQALTHAGCAHRMAAVRTGDAFAP